MAQICYEVWFCDRKSTIGFLIEKWECFSIFVIYDFLLNKIGSSYHGIIFTNVILF